MLGWTGVLKPTSPRITAFDYVAASAKGFAAGERSRFAYKKFIRDLTAQAPEFICMAYGQVDAEVGYYYRKFVAGESQSPEADLSAVYDAYIEMITIALPDGTIALKGLNPSTLRDDTQLTNYAFRRLTNRIQQESSRAQILTALQDACLSASDHGALNSMANEILAEKARKAGLAFFDIREIAEDPVAPGLAKWSLVPAESDVHLTDSYKVRKAYHEGLVRAFES